MTAVILAALKAIDSKVTPERWEALIYQGSLLQRPRLEDLPKWARHGRH